MPYSDKNYKVSNVNYLNKDFESLKSTLIEYAKTYFPNSYRDFNETSPGMMLIEMGAYVGDVLSFYIDQQYKEMLLPLAEERRNIINLANAFGYKVKPILPAYVDLSISQVLDAVGDINNLQPDYSSAELIPIRTSVQSSADSNLVFQTLDVVDFTVSGSNIEVNTIDDNGVVSDFKLTKKVRAISAETKTKDFTIGTPEKFLRLTLDETNVVDVISVKDSIGNEYFEVDYLVQDNVPIETHYTEEGSNRTSAYDVDDSTVVEVPVPYTLSFQRTSKKFITEVNDDDTTSLVFGNGILRNGQIQQSNLLQTEQVGLVIPGETQNFVSSIDPLVNLDNRSTLGETPANTTLTVTYRVGGGTSANAAVGDLTTFVGLSVTPVTTVTNETPAYGGSDGQSVDEIREAAKAYFATQNRCVTQEDYEARTLAMPAKFGGIAKVFCNRAVTNVIRTNATLEESYSNIFNELQNILTTFSGLVDEQGTLTEMQTILSNLANIGNDPSDNSITPRAGEEVIESADEVVGEVASEVTDEIIDEINVEPPVETNNEALDTPTDTENNFTLNQEDIILLQELIGNVINTVSNQNTAFQSEIDLLEAQPSTPLISATIDLHLLSYDENGKLTPITNPLDENNEIVSHPLKTNLKNYLSQFRLLTDEVNFIDGKIINFGVEFEVVAHRGMNKSEVKLKVIDTIRNYFTTDKMQFRQPIYTNDVIYEVMGIDGVRSVNKLELVQEFSDALGSPPLYYFTQDKPNGVDGFDSRYNWKYDFKSFYGGAIDNPDTTTMNEYVKNISSDGVILPSVTPSVFELKFPNKDIRGKVI